MFKSIKGIIDQIKYDRNKTPKNEDECNEYIHPKVFTTITDETLYDDFNTTSYLPIFTNDICSSDNIFVRIYSIKKYTFMDTILNIFRKEKVPKHRKCCYCENVASLVNESWDRKVYVCSNHYMSK